MVYCVQAQLAFSSATRRNNILSDMQTRIANKQRWSVDELYATSFRFGANGIHTVLRFTTPADADDLKARVESIGTGQNAPVAGSWISVHTCSHDEGSNSCSETARRVW